MGGFFQYGDPSKTTTLLGPKPPCWGTSKYDNSDRECRMCSFSSTCREQTIRAKVVPAAPATNYFSQFQPPGTYAAPQTVVQPIRYQAPPAPILRVNPQTAPIQQVQPAIPVAPNQVIDRYGQIQDPMLVTMRSTPSINRPQFQGETFLQRVMKNIALAAVESVLGEAMLGVRQFMWIPQHGEDEKK